jgi:nitric oxide reductase subunit B
MQTLVWLRMPGDVVFAAGAGMLALFVAKLYIGKRKPAPIAATPVAEATTGR